MQDFASQFLRFVLKLVLGVFALLFAVSLIAVAVIVLAWTLLKALLTGKKLAPAVVFGRFQRFSPQGTQGMWPGAVKAQAKAADVVDVEAREIPGDKHLR